MIFTNGLTSLRASICTLLIAFPAAMHADQWTKPVSEEYPPITCDLGTLPIAARCTGRYCDDFQFLCRLPWLTFIGDPGFTVMKREWRDFISEEYPNHRVDCGSDALITGMACKGKYCDNVAVECTTLEHFRPSHLCEWRGPLSEEQGSIGFYDGRDWPLNFPRAMSCHGPYCDNKWFYVCRLSSR